MNPAGEPHTSFPSKTCAPARLSYRELATRPNAPLEPKWERRPTDGLLSLYRYGFVLARCPPLSHILQIEQA
jgi:hypothetical protein